MSFSKKLEKAFHDVDEGRKGRLDAAAAHAALVCAGSRPSLPLERIVALLPSYSASPAHRPAAGIDLGGFKSLHEYLKRGHNVTPELD